MSYELYRAILNTASLDAKVAEEWYEESGLSDEHLRETFELFFPNTSDLLRLKQLLDLPAIVLEAVKQEVLTYLWELEESKARNQLIELISNNVWIHSNYMCSSFDGENLAEVASSIKTYFQKNNLQMPKTVDFFVGMLG